MKQYFRSNYFTGVNSTGVLVNYLFLSPSHSVFIFSQPNEVTLNYTLQWCVKIKLRTKLDETE